jgi:plasmid stability protein
MASIWRQNVGTNLSIKGVPEAIAARLRERAARNHRSLQGELMAIVERAAAEPLPEPGAASSAITADSWVQGWQTMDELLAEREAAGWKPDPRMADLPRAVDIIRADRDSR